MTVRDYYNLREQPFGAAPDSHYLFLNPTHKEAPASLIYGIESVQTEPSSQPIQWVKFW
jgi:hypothetical protein